MPCPRSASWLESGNANQELRWFPRACPAPGGPLPGDPPPRAQGIEVLADFTDFPPSRIEGLTVLPSGHAWISTEGYYTEDEQEWFENATVEVRPDGSLGRAASLPTRWGAPGPESTYRGRSPPHAYDTHTQPCSRPGGSF